MLHLFSGRDAKFWEKEDRVVPCVVLELEREDGTERSVLAGRTCLRSCSTRWMAIRSLDADVLALHGRG